VWGLGLRADRFVSLDREESAMATAASTVKNHNGKVRLLGILVIIAGVILIVAGVVTWFVVRNQLANENIVVSDDADMFAGQEVNGPFTAYAQANIINEHALESTGGLTYAELPRDSELRQTAMTASFLRASLFTSVVAFGVAAFAAGLGVVLLLIGWALRSLAKGPVAVVQPVTAAPAASAEPEPDVVEERTPAEEPPVSPEPAVTSEPKA
jgi:hypothetical protein